MSEPTGLFRHGGPLQRSMTDMFASLGLDDGARTLRAVFDAERPALDELFRKRAQWPELFRRLALFPEGECERAAAEYLDWRADILYWKALVGIYSSELQGRVVVRGLENLRAADDGTSRFVLAPFHIRQFPLLVPALRSLGTRYVVIASVNNPGDVTADPLPEQPTVVLDSKDSLVLLRARQAMAQQRALVVYPDLQRGGAPQRIQLPFVGRELVAQSSWHLFCLNEQIPALPCFVTAGPGNTVEMTIGEPLEPPRNEDEAAEMVRRLYAFYEQPVRESGMQWEGWAEAAWVGDDVLADAPDPVKLP
ncbi:lysophospholipid acyltransferase family protein [Streptomyces diastaticus]|uniref:hypothetical protein n=1 Tax=Streptomyces diastaticus TaxID=1956 RepID=UPI003655E234